MRLLTVILLVVLSGSCNSAIGQQVSSAAASSDRVDTIAYRTLFRRAILYQKLADEADASHAPKPQLRRILAARFDLNDADSASLGRLSSQYQAEIEPIHQKITKAIKSFRARFPSGVIPRGADKTPPPELKELQSQEDAVTLRYRDLLRTSMHEEDFQKVNTKVRKDFSNQLAR